LEPERWRRIEDLYHRALQMAATRRIAFLEDSCPQDEGLRREVESLLAHDQAAENFIESPAVQIAGKLLADDLTIAADGATLRGDDRTIGPYRLIQQLGAGGMGEVWLAEQNYPVKRRVAIKLIRAGMNTREVITRFESERQALALMDHPAVAKVFDGGSTSSGLPYFAMEYVPGVPITDWCDKCKLTVAERLELFMQVCEGVKHAHQKAIIHRDLKPSNILITKVDGNAAPKIIDFGVAKAVGQKLSEETLLTRVGAILGTPEYMSPEQADSAGGDIDTRTDVYSLGVILYQLLAGAAPIELTQLTFEGMLRQLREDDPPRPSVKVRALGQLSTIVCANRGSEPRALIRQLRGDLDSIVLKALEKQRTRRYGSPSELATDIGRHLRHEPVMAQTQSYSYRARKFVRRYRWGVAATTSVALALIIGLSAALWEARVARTEAQAAEREAQTSAAVQQFVTDIFETNSRTQSDPVQARQTTARQLLDIGAQKIDGGLHKAPAAKEKMLETLANLYLGLGLDDQAVMLSRQRVALAKASYGANSPKVAEALCFLATCMEASRFVDERERVLLQAEKILDVNHDFSSPARGELLRNLAKHYKSTDQQKARDYANQAVAFYRKGRPSVKLAQALYDQAVSYALFDEYAKGEVLAAESVSIARNLGNEGAAVSVESEELLAEINVRLLHYESAKQNFELAFKGARDLNGVDHVDTVETEVGLGDFYRRISQNTVALSHLKHSLDTCIRLRGSDDSFHMPQVLLMYGFALKADGQFEAGLASISQAVENRRKNRPGTRELGQAIWSQASVLVDLGEYEKAKRCLDEAADLSKKVGFKLQSEYILARLKLAFDLKQLDQASQIIESFYGPLPDRAPLSSDLLANLTARAQLALSRNDAADARVFATRLSTIVAESPNRNYLKVWEERATLAEGQAYLLENRGSKAVPRLQRAVQLDEEMYDFPSAELIPSRVALALAYLQAGNHTQSAKLLTLVESIHRMHPHLGERFEEPLRELRSKLAH
jgi:serine/threonine protein kinase